MDQITLLSLGTERQVFFSVTDRIGSLAGLMCLAIGVGISCAVTSPFLCINLISTRFISRRTTSNQEISTNGVVSVLLGVLAGVFAGG